MFLSANHLRGVLAAQGGWKSPLNDKAILWFSRTFFGFKVLGFQGLGFRLGVVKGRRPTASERRVEELMKVSSSAVSCI